MGRPDSTIWPDLPFLPNVNLPSFNSVLTHKRYALNNLRARMQKTMRITNLGVDLLEKLLEWDPKKRISAKYAAIPTNQCAGEASSAALVAH